VDADPEPNRRALMVGEAPAQSERGADGRLGAGELDQHRVPEALDDPASALGGDLARRHLKTLDVLQRGHLVPRGQRGIADDVGEPDGRQVALRNGRGRSHGSLT
jgi:hypothetical protein